MAEKQVKIKLGFDAEVEQAMQKIQKLSNTLNSIANAKISVSGGNLEAATKAAKVLNQEILKATNAETGKLDFSKLQASLKSSGQDLNQLTNQLLAMGPKGQQAFNQVASAIATAELRTKKMNGTLVKFGTTLMNTVRWQASTALINAFTGAVQGAIGYIEDLDKSLNNIRIVTGKSTLEMASFAKMANQAAKELKTTTTEYTNASLIYFQQGLDTKEVLERTQATVKMAQVTGGAVEEVSNQLTAIWNNFDNGTKSLEYYADVITALGAATASSTEEISTGLEKFAAIAETVGLSYEYATAALATVTAETRQSAEVVGTAFKTLFARIQDLELGKTLDDGTTMGQYSEALMKVGINIKDANGSLKDMDAILNEMGAKWDTLTKDSQVALAQNVAGVRQYTQLMALMENWDTMKENVNIGKNAEGELNKQHKIYTSSLEALDDELKATAEGLYNKLLNPEMVADFKEALIDIVNIFDRILDAAGGLDGLLTFGGLVIAKTLLPHLSNFMLQVKGHLSDMIGLTQLNKYKTVKNMAKEAHSMAGSDGANVQQSGAFVNVSQNLTSQRDIMKENAGLTGTVLDHTAKLLAYENNLTEKQKISYENWIKNLELRKEELRIARERQLVEQEALESAETRGSTIVARTRDDENAPQMIQDDNTYEEEKIKLTQEREQKKINVDEFSKKQDELEAKIAEKEREIEKYTRSRDDYNHRASERQGLTEEKRAELREQGKAEDGKRLYALGELDALKSQRDRNSARLANAKTELEEDQSIDIEEEAKSRSMRKATSQEYDMAGRATASALEGINDARKNGELDGATEALLNGLENNSDGSIKANINNMKAIGEKKAELAHDKNVFSDLSSEINTISQEQQDQEQETKKGKKQKPQKKDQKKANAEMEKTAKIQDKLNSSIKKYGVSWEKALDDISEAKDETEETKKAVTTLKNKMGKDGINLGDLNKEELRVVEKALGTVSSEIQGAADQAELLGEAFVQDASQATGENIEYFENIENGAQGAAESAYATEDALENANEQLQQPQMEGDLFGQIGKGAEQALGAITSFSMGATMLSSGVTMAFNEEASMIERISGAMMIAQGVQSILNAAKSVGNVIITIGTALKAKENLEDLKSIGILGLLKKVKEKGILTTIKETAVTVVNSVAKLFNAEASKGLVGVAMAAAGATLILGTILVANTIITNKNTEAKIEEAEASQKSAEASKEAAQAAQEEYDKVKELTEAYKDALKTYEETGTGKDQLINKGIEVANALDIENAGVLILTGNYEQLNKEIEKRLKLKAQENLKAQSDSATSSFGAFSMKAQTSSGGMWVNAEKKHMGIYFNDDGSKETEFIDDFLKTEEGKKYKEIGWRFGENSLWIPYYDNSDGNNKLATLDALMQDAYNWAMENWEGDTTKSVVYKKYQQMGDNGELDAKNSAIEAENSFKNAAIDVASLESGMDNVENYEDYIAARENFVEQLLNNNIDIETDEGKKLFEDFLKNKGFFAYESMNNSFEDFKNKYKEVNPDGEIDPNDLEQTLRDWGKRNGFGEGEYDKVLELFFKISPLTQDTIEEVTEAMDTAKGIVEGEKLQLKIEAEANALNDLKEFMTASDWQNYKNTHKDLFDPTSDKYIGLSFEDFVSKGYGEQQKILSANQNRKVEAEYEQIEGLESQLAYRRSSVIQSKTRIEEIEAEQNKLEDQIESPLQTKDEMENASGTVRRKKVYKGQGKQGSDKIVWSDVTKNINDEGISEDERDEIAKQLGYQDYQDYQNQYNLISKHEELEQEKKELIDNISTSESTIDSISTDLAEKQENKFLLEIEEFNRQVQALEITEEEFSNVVSDIMSNNTSLTQEEAKKQALNLLQVEKGLESLSETWEDYGAIVSDKSNKNLPEYTEGIEKLKEGFSKLTGIDISNITDDMIESAIESGNLQKAINGDYEALLKIRNLDPTVIMYRLKIDKSDPAYNEVQKFLQDDRFVNMTLGAKIDESWAKAMVLSLMAQGKSILEIEDIFKQLGFENLQMTVEQKENYNWGQEYVDTNGDGIKDKATGRFWVQETEDSEKTWFKDEDEYRKNWVNFGFINSETGETATFGSEDEAGLVESKWTEPVYKEDYKIDQDEWDKKKKNIDEETERYYKLNKQLEQYNHELALMDQEIEKAYGPEKIKLLDKKIGLQEKSLQTEKDLLKAMKATATSKGKELKELGGEFSEDGRLLNYDDLMASWINEYNTTMTEMVAEAQSIEDAKYKLAANRDSMSEQEIHEAERSIEQREKALDKKEKENDDKYKERTDAIKEYDDAWNDVLSQTEKVNDEINKIAEQHLEKINLEAELKLTITEVSRKEIDYYLGKIEDDFFSMAEGVALISSKAHLDLQDLSTYETKMNQILSDTALTAEQRAQALKELQDNFISSLQAVQEIDKQMLAYYGEALAASKEEFDSYASQLDNASSKLEHFSSLAGLIGKSYDRKYMGEILNAQYDVAKKNAEASKGYVDLLKQQKASIEKDLKTATGGQKELLEEELKAITQSLNEAEDEWLSDLEAMGEAAQAILENTLGKAREELEKSLYGTSIQDYIESLDRLSAEQEGYLTETNKLYETNKLIRQAQMDMDKTSNIRAKQQYAEYIKQIEQKQKSGELSEYELSIAQAEFEVLQARIALEEAQSAKDQVRLTRDAEGNYGYVYTANANKVADAEQKLADAQNNLYNIGLDGYKEFTSKQAQLQQEALDAINEILEDETLSREEKEKKIAEIQEHYHTLMKQNEEQYQLAIGAMKENSYNNQVDYNTRSIVLADEFKTETNKYLGEVEDAYEDYDLKVDSITETVGDDLGTLKTKTGEVKTETQNLKTAIDNLNKDIATELQHVRDRTTEWGKFRDTLKEAVEYNEKLMEVNGDMTRINSGDSTLIGKDISQQIMNYASTGGNDIEVLATYAASRSHKIARDKDLYKQLKAGEILSTEEILKKAGYDEKTIKAVLDMAKQSSLVTSDSGMFFDTGGYTGSWGPEGKMAVLHEKEIVLNKQDTSNLLQAITMLREISNMIDRQAMYQSLSLLDSRLFDVFTERDNTLQQEVTIHAEFPNVNDHNEIEIALNDLITRASQYANRF